jgi:hypothetical protein
VQSQFTTYAINNLGPSPNGSYPVVCQSPSADRIEVRENYNSANPPTQDLVQFSDTNSPNSVAIPKGTSAIFTAPPGGRFYQGQTVGGIATAAGAIIAAQLESSEV